MDDLTRHAASVPHTAGLSAGTVTLKVDGRELRVYRAQPEGKSHLPVVLVVSEICGVHEQIAEVARRLAGRGYLALAPELFVRQGDAARVAPGDGTADAQVLADLDAVVAWARANGGNGDKIAITGFCWGGRITWLYAAHNPAIKAGAAWYGRLAGEARLQPRPTFPGTQSMLLAL